MTKKIALISVHNDPNYGSMLQAYALSAALSKLGYPNEYIEYNPYKEKNKILNCGISLVKSVLSVFGIIKKTEYSYWHSKPFRKQRELFREFHTAYIPSSTRRYNINDIQVSNAEYAKFIIGSDQTWSPLVTSSPNTLNFLGFVSDNSKKTAYAPSIGTTHISPDYLPILKKHLSSFSSLSCREKQNAELLTTFLGKKVSHVLDPTFLLTKDDWQKLEEEIAVPPKFILCYILGTKKCISDFAESLGREKGLPVLYIVTRPESFIYDNILQNVSVGQFLFLLNHATYVVTDSFHGSILSINYGTNFYSFAKRETSNGFTDNDRIMDFLSIIGLQNRFKTDSDSTYEEDIDFVKCHQILEPLRSKSVQYLSNLISKK